MVFSVFIILCGVLSVANSQECTTQEMVYNGDFSQPELTSEWTILGYLPGGNGVWTSLPANNGFRIQQQGTYGAPAKNSEGVPSGQSLLVNGNEDWAQVSYYVTIPCMLESNKGTYSFDYWFLPDYPINSFEFTIEQKSTVLVSESLAAPKKGWVSVSQTFDIVACQPLKLTFTSDATRGGGVVIDNVSLKSSVCSGIEMVDGGDFEAVSLCTSSETLLKLPCSTGTWRSTLSKPGFVVWQQGAMGIPKYGANGEPTGNVLEVNGLTNKAQLSYQYFVPPMLGVAESTVSFQYYIRAVGNINYFGIELEQDGSTALTKSLTSSFKSGEWVFANYTIDLMASKAATLTFIADTSGCCDSCGGIYIDKVSVKSTERITEAPTCACPADEEIEELTKRVQQSMSEM
eukprot:TRINITY_DN9322_c0_g1_i1.p1 TRINITY_DN9322_c0_g1~~TRINITY_DN9322_c0_g1_i1.p1  ORF type:complete len:403 (+),score=32.92 TRINITY_DN9322_c0_g1_i1:151-1359(+)